MTPAQEEEFRTLTDRMMQRGLIKLDPKAATEEQMKSERMAEAHQRKLEREATGKKFFPR